MNEIEAQTPAPFEGAPPVVPKGYRIYTDPKDFRALPEGSAIWTGHCPQWVFGEQILAVPEGNFDCRVFYAVPESVQTDTDQESVLQEAERLVNGDRQKDYGSASESFRRIAALWSAYRGVEFTPKDVACMMILMKVSRSVSSDKRDNWVDIIGYAELGSKLQ